MSKQEIAAVQITKDISSIEQQNTVVNEINVIDYEQLKTQAGFIQVTPFNPELVRHQEWEAAPVSAHVGMVINELTDNADYAWSWHCAIATNMAEAGCDPKTAQIGAAKFINMLTQGACDTTKSGYYKTWMDNWEATTNKALKEGTSQGISPAMDTLKDALNNDAEYAWSWHCNLAMAFIDEGADRLKSQKGAARFLSLLTFGECDITKNNHYIDWMEAYRKAENAPKRYSFVDEQGTGGVKAEGTLSSVVDPA